MFLCQYIHSLLFSLCFYVNTFTETFTWCHTEVIRLKFKGIKISVHLTVRGYLLNLEACSMNLNLTRGQRTFPSELIKSPHICKSLYHICGGITNNLHTVA